MSTGLPLVSAVMPVYNRQAYLSAAIDSVLGQTYPRLELIVMNDGSNDGTEEILAGYGDRIRIVHQTNRGQGVARNRGAEIANGTLLAFLDSDDLWDSSKIASQVRLWLDHPEAVAVYCDYRNINESGAVTRHSAALTGAHPSGRILEHLLLRSCQGPPSVLLVRRDAFMAVGGFNETYSYYSEDYALWLKLATMGAILYQPKTLASYRRHSAQTTSAGARAEYMRAHGMCAALEELRCYLNSQTEERVRKLYLERLWTAQVTLGWLAGRHGDWRTACRSYMTALSHRPWRLDFIWGMMKALAKARRCLGRTMPVTGGQDNGKVA